MSKNQCQQQHQSVMLDEAIAALKIKPKGIYIDATFGCGGHSRAVLDKLGSSGRLLVIDKDPAAIAIARKLAKLDPRVQAFHGSFAKINEIAREQDIIGQVDGVVFDLGICSTQIDIAARGFSFSKSGNLDMRMDPSTGISAADWLNQAKEEDIVYVLKTYGEERFAKGIARGIVLARKLKPISTTNQLVDIINKVIPFKPKNKHPATRSFQAIRIFINKELEDLQTTLKEVLPVLSSHGRLVVISFHSLEDRIVKQFIAEHTKTDFSPRRLAVKYNAVKPKLAKIAKLKPSLLEVKNNVRSRSAILRVAEKNAS